MWEREVDRLALLELVASGRLRRRQTQGEAFDELGRLPWVRRTGRRDEVVLAPDHRATVVGLLDRCWPEWREIVARLAEQGLSIDQRGFERLRDLERRAALPEVPERLNRRTATAAVGPHSKAALTSFRLEGLDDVAVTRDGVARLRPSPGLELVRDGVAHDACRLATLLGEIALSERALRDGTRFAGVLPRAVLLVENKGPYVDLMAPAGWLVAHVPGWDTATVTRLLEQLPGCPLVHFGDLDPNGVRIVRHLRAFRPDLVWAIPGFWAEYVADRGRRAEWPEELDVSAEPVLVRELARRGLWLEQETITLDPRLREALERLVPRP